MRVKDVVAEIEHNLRVLDGYQKAEIARLEMRINTPQTATCCLCRRRDFLDNLADVGWMKSEELGEHGDLIYLGSAGYIFAHPECAKIKKSDDGKGWVRIVKGDK